MGYASGADPDGAAGFGLRGDVPVSGPLQGEAVGGGVVGGEVLDGEPGRVRVPGVPWVLPMVNVPRVRASRVCWNSCDHCPVR